MPLPPRDPEPGRRAAPRTVARGARSGAPLRPAAPPRPAASRPAVPRGSRDPGPRDPGSRSGGPHAGASRAGAFAPRRAPGSRRGGRPLTSGPRRLWWGLVLVVVPLLVVTGKLVLLQGVDGGAYANAAEQDRLQTHPIAALRGAVVDRDGNPFAYTVEASRVVADPTVVDDPERTALALSALLDVPVDELTERLTAEGRYVVLARQVPPETTDAVDELGLAGVSFEDDPVRLYPAGAVGGQVVGWVGRDGAGLGGVELRFEDALAGTDGQRRVEVGSGGNPIPSGIDESTPATDGSTVELTVDQDVQFTMEQRLAQACADGATTRASAVVLDVHTGEVVAMGSCPGYDPARAGSTDPDLLGNPVVSDVFEPGSVMKAVTLAAAIEEGRAAPDTVLTVDGHIQAGDVVVTDAHDHAPVDWTVTGILAKSSNVGTIMLAREVGDATLERYLRAFGVGEETGIELPGESAGILESSADWTESRAANVPIGQGLSVTTLQMASVFQAIANDGVRVPPRLVESVTAPDGTTSTPEAPEATRVIGEDTAEDLAYVLEAVVGPGGTAPLGEVDGYRVAGKTGTAQRANPECGCYEGGGYVTTFVGFAPADDPQYVVAVDLERPTSSAEGGQVAAPVFADVMRYVLTNGGVVPSGTARPDFALTGADLAAARPGGDGGGTGTGTPAAGD
ncbi:cell division protein FtsI (penicillin-binding protein 3) [Geodermatophilus bullaregiensis]|uniref:peptidoglycan D,D-transpeptidase FtsI family protein n=1 Tax=Geodermatophilus bullaregiensis TaxID=1564160 RepID=UPI0027DB0EDE|nr:penicillin-binding protein 2 [Geodermatophilus bullaregiensis]MBM7804791.1 cell division protein FtsI (penicillin-binding protein 3) [Geodermatophilus bullaregiensis]